MKLMLLGDTHGNTKFVTEVVIPEAKRQGVHWIYQVGDFGYWEHTDEGQLYLNVVNEACIAAGVEIVFIQGNHDKVSLIPRMYGEVVGFFPVRPTIWFAPNGLVWSPNAGKTNFLALGGAYSIDKDWRIKQERARATKLAESLRFEGYSERYRMATAIEETEHTLWFPEEQMTDEEFDSIINTVTDRVDIILAHDKPFASNLPFRLIDIPECVPNQKRLQTAIKHFRPDFFVHGHFHARYTDAVRSGDSNSMTDVVGLGADVPNYNQSESSWKPSDAWMILNI